MNRLMANEEIVTMTSLEVVELINNFRLEEGNRVLKEHKDFMKSVRKEIETLEVLGVRIEGNFSPYSYVAENGKTNPCYKMNKDGVMQMLNKESALVRYKTQQYINALENRLKQRTSSYSTDALLSNPDLIIGLASKVKELQSGIDVKEDEIKGLNDKIDEISKQHEDEIKKKKDGNNKILTLSQLIDKINITGLNTTKFNDWLCSKGFGIYVRFPDEKRRTFQPNERFKQYIAGEGYSFTRTTNDTGKIVVTYTIEMFDRIMNKYHDELCELVKIEEEF